MKLDILRTISMINQSVTTARTLLDLLEHHGVCFDCSMPTHLGHVDIGDMYPATESPEVLEEINALLRGAGLTELKPEDYLTPASTFKTVLELRSVSGPSIPEEAKLPEPKDKPFPKVKKEAKERKARVMSPEARQRIADAQTKRHEANRLKKAAGTGGDGAQGAA